MEESADDRRTRIPLEARRDAKHGRSAARGASGFARGPVRGSGLSARTIRREIDRAVEEKRLDAPDRYVHLQVRRLTKALRAADARIDRGDMAAVAPFLKVVAALDRYHGLKEPFRPSQRARRAIPPDPAPPLALPCPAPDDLAPEVE